MIDTIKFIERYCLIEGKHIKLNNSQREIIKFFEKWRNKRRGI